MSRDADDETQDVYPLRKAEPKLSRTPSWVMLGFLFGAAWMYLWQRGERAKQPEPAAVRIVEVPAKPAAPRTAQPLSTIEAVWAAALEDGKTDIDWNGDATEVALWNRQERAFADFYEVRRAGGQYYFRTIPSLTRRVVNRGKGLETAALRFTESEARYQEWLEHGRSEKRPDVAVPAPAVPKP